MVGGRLAKLLDEFQQRLQAVPGHMHQLAAMFMNILYVFLVLKHSFPCSLFLSIYQEIPLGSVMDDILSMVP